MRARQGDTRSFINLLNGEQCHSELVYNKLCGQVLHAEMVDATYNFTADGCQVEVINI